MTEHQRSEHVKAAARELGFDRCGIASAGPMAHGEFVRGWLASGYAGTMDYLHRHLESRLDLCSWLPWARSVIVVALNYHQPAPAEPQIADPRPQRTGSPLQQPTVAGSHDGTDSQTAGGRARAPLLVRGRVALYAWGQDYHQIMRHKLESLVEMMRAVFDGPFQARICVDTTGIVERELAAAAGIGWIGKNTMVLHHSLGSFFYLGEIITDLLLAPDEPLPDRCGTCTACLDACPTMALCAPHVMDASRCISYLTIEHRGEIDPDLARNMNGWVFGCDVCQTVCPYNRRAPCTTEPRLQGRQDDAAPLLSEILAWDDRAYRAHVHSKTTTRAKLHMWKRNAQIALCNAQRR